VGIVVPGERILELIDNDPVFKAIREQEKNNGLKKSAADE
jgi:hypothetical protein